MRITIKVDNRKYLETLAKKWGMTLPETLNYLLRQSRLNGFSKEFRNADFDTSKLPEIQPPQSFYEELAKEEFIPIDPVIERMSTLIEEF